MSSDFRGVVQPAQLPDDERAASERAAVLVGPDVLISKETGGDDLSGGQSNLAPGQHYFAQLFSSGPVPAGQTVIITVGTRIRYLLDNDMELHSSTNFQWFISSVEVRIAP